jgi:hypothetical protein
MARHVTAARASKLAFRRNAPRDGKRAFAGKTRSSPGASPRASQRYCEASLNAAPNARANSGVPVSVNVTACQPPPSTPTCRS